jgi:hypothetical protein
MKGDGYLGRKWYSADQMVTTLCEAEVRSACPRLMCQCETNDYHRLDCSQEMNYQPNAWISESGLETVKMSSPGASIKCVPCSGHFDIAK